LKRGFPQKIGPQFPNAACQSQLNASVELPVAPSCKKTAEVLNRVRRITEAAAASVVQQSDSDWVERLLKPVLADSNCQRRVRHSAAAVGLALSMGAPTVAELLFQGSEAYAADAATSVQPDVASLGSPDLGASEFADVVAPEPIALGGVELSGSTATPAPVPPIALLARASESAPLTETQGFTYHIVQPGETLSTIARAYGVSASDVVSLNALPQASLLTTGQTLKVPFGASLTAAAPAAVKVASLPDSSVDDTIARLRQQRQQLQGSLGNLRAEAVAVATEASAPEPIVDLSSLSPYRVKPGDTLDTIARQHSLTRSELVAINRLDNPNVLRVDQVINLPKTAVAVQSVAAPIATAPASVAPAPDVVELPSVTVSPSKKGAAALMPTAESAPSTFRVSSMPLRSPKLKANAVTPSESAPAVAQLAPMTVPATKVATASDRPSASPIPGSVYRVELGDTVAKIARSYGVSMQELLSINNISDANIIFVGQQLTVPGSSQVAGLPSAVESLVAAAPSVTPTLSVAPRRSLAVQTVPSLTAIAPAPVAASPTTDQGYVDTLVSEIRQLRQRYQSGSQAAVLPIPAPAKLTVTPAPAAVSKGIRVNPEFNTAGVVARSVAPKPSNQLVASASLGSQSYEPLVQTLLGKAVSPELPGLNSDSLLPDGAMAGFVWPAKGQFTSGYGWRWGRMHKGIDIAADEGTPIHAAAGGVVTYSAWNDGGYGNLVEITHPDGTITMYAHNSRLLVRQGQRVRQGQQISEMGNTGFSTGPHLHFEIRTPGQGAVNPIAYLPK
jgi:murein DD-endopeptidase MepM/ murein hydrolase activator NlpD